MTLMEDREVEKEAGDKKDKLKDPLSIYIQDISRAPLLTAKDEEYLGNNIQGYESTLSRDEAMDLMTRSNLRLVVSIAKKYVGKGTPLMDLIGAGNVGLITAVEKYDPSFGTRFSTYATQWIRQAIGKYVANDSVIHTPIGALLESEKLKQIEGEHHSDSDLEKITGMNESKIKTLKKLIKARVGVVPFLKEDRDGEIYGEQDYALEEQDSGEKSLMIDDLKKFTERLDSRTRRILELRYEQGMTLEQIGKDGGVKLTKERVRQIEKKCIEKLRRYFGVGKNN